MMEKYKAIEKAMCEELEDIGRRLDGGAEMTPSDLEKIDMLSHALKSLATYRAMKDAEEYEGMSGRMGRYGRDGENYSRSYSDGYSRGYDDARQMSGHYPMMRPEYDYRYMPERPRW